MGTLSLVFLSITFLVILIMISLIFTHLYAKHIYSGIKFWVLGSLFYFISVLVYILRLNMNDTFTFFTGNGALALGMIFFAYGTNKFLNEKTYLKLHLYLFLAVFSTMAIFKYGLNYLEPRQIFMSLFIIYIMTNILITSFKYITKDGYRFLVTHLIGSSGIILLHVLRIITVLTGENSVIITEFGVSVDDLILIFVGVLVIQTVFSMTFYVNYKSLIALKNERHNLELASMTDYLTQLPNRRMLSSYLDNLIKQNKRFAIIMTDVDGFKTINDKYGHDIGDLVIQEYGKVLMQTKRPHDFVARYGGDEFIIVVEDFVSKESLFNNLEKKIQAVNNSIEVASIQFMINASVGISVFNEDGNNIEDLIKKADQALYYVKSTGKNNIAFYQDIIKQ